MGCLAGPGMVIASHNLDCLLKDVRASPPLLRFVKQDTTVGLMEALGSESGSEQFGWGSSQALAHLTTWAAFSRTLVPLPTTQIEYENNATCTISANLNGSKTLK